jgi:hypothetical protein
MKMWTREEAISPEERKHDLPVEHLTDEQKAKYGW